MTTKTNVVLVDLKGVFYMLKNLLGNGFVNLYTVLFTGALLLIILSGLFFVGSFFYYILF